MNKLLRSVALPLAGLGLLMACGDDGGSGPDPGITVTGVVQDRAGEPVGGAAVLVPGKTPVTSGSDGRFSILGVGAPYDIAAILTSQHTAVVYKGLNRSDPTLLYPDVRGPEQTATISGTTPSSIGNVTLAHFISSNGVAALATADPTTGEYTMTVTWHRSAGTLSGHLYVLRGTSGTQWPPASYDGYASKPLTITAGGDFSGNDFAAAELIDPPEHSLGGLVAVPAGYTLRSRVIWFDFGGGPSFYWGEVGTLPSAFTRAVPVVSGLGFGVAARAEDASSRWSYFVKSGITGSSTDIGIPLAEAAQLTAPADGATDVDVTTAFSWSQGGGAGINVFTAVPNSSTDPRFFVFTAGTDAKIPDLATQGFGLPSAAGYQWRVHRLFPVASINDAAGEGFLSWLNLKAGDIGETAAGGFGFTTKTAAAAALQRPAGAPRPAGAQARPWRGLTRGLDDSSMGPR